MKFENGRGEILTNFLNCKGNPLCREERQYALFLYNALLDVKRKGNWEVIKELMDNNETKVKQLFGLVNDEKVKDDELKKIKLEDIKLEDIKLENIHIKQVFYEATLMRDLFYSCDDNEKKEFNKELLKFVLSYKYSSEDEYLNYNANIIKELEGSESLGGPVGSKKIRSKVKYFVPKYKEKSKDKKKITTIDMDYFNKKTKDYIIASRLQLAKYMMRAIPDILVSYTIGDGKKEYVRAIECKYESGIGAYEDIFGQGRQLQIFVQRLIMTFLFGNEEMERQKKYTKLDVRTDKDRWNAVYGDLCIDINNKDNNAENMGVTVVQFTSEDEKSSEEIESSKKSKSSEGYIEIPISKLLQEQYASRNEKTSLNDR